MLDLIWIMEKAFSPSSPTWGFIFTQISHYSTQNFITCNLKRRSIFINYLLVIYKSSVITFHSYQDVLWGGKGRFSATNWKFLKLHENHRNSTRNPRHIWIFHSHPVLLLMLQDHVLKFFRRLLNFFIPLFR